MSSAATTTSAGRWTSADAVRDREAALPVEHREPGPDDRRVAQHDQAIAHLDDRQAKRLPDLRGREADAARRAHRGDHLLNEPAKTAIGQAHGAGRGTQSLVGRGEDPVNARGRPHRDPGRSGRRQVPEEIGWSWASVPIA